MGVKRDLIGCDHKPPPGLAERREYRIREAIFRCLVYDQRGYRRAWIKQHGKRDLA